MELLDSPDAVKSRSRPLARSLVYRAEIVFIPFLVLTTGCVSTGSFPVLCDAPPTGPVCQVVATWVNEVAFAADPIHGGAKNPGLAGRLYLFGEKVDFPKAGDGSLVIDLFDETSKTPSPIPLEEWRFDKDTLKRLLRRDPIGWGYTLFLPWGTYKPEITKVHLKIRYEQAGAFPLYSESSVTLNPTEGDIRTATARRSAPAAQAGSSAEKRGGPPDASVSSTRPALAP